MQIPVGFCLFGIEIILTNPRLYPNGLELHQQHLVPWGNLSFYQRVHLPHCNNLKRELGSDVEIWCPGSQILAHDTFFKPVCKELLDSIPVQGH